MSEKLEHVVSVFKLKKSDKVEATSSNTSHGEQGLKGRMEILVNSGNGKEETAQQKEIASDFD